MEIIRELENNKSYFALDKDTLYWSEWVIRGGLLDEESEKDVLLRSPIQTKPIETSTIIERNLNNSITFKTSILNQDVKDCKTTFQMVSDRLIIAPKESRFN